MVLLDNIKALFMMAWEWSSRNRVNKSINIYSFSYGKSDDVYSRRNCDYGGTSRGQGLVPEKALHSFKLDL
jgi:hypothetical protein